VNNTETGKPQPNNLTETSAGKRCTEEVMRMEITLHDHSRLVFTCARTGLLNVELYQPGTLRDGHGHLLRGSTQLVGEDLKAFVSAIVGPQEPELLPAA
jgi:hypothetical protein